MSLAVLCQSIHQALNSVIPQSWSVHLRWSRYPNLTLIPSVEGSPQQDRDSSAAQVVSAVVRYSVVVSGSLQLRVLVAAVVSAEAGVEAEETAHHLIGTLCHATLYTSPCSTKRAIFRQHGTPLISQLGSAFVRSKNPSVRSSCQGCICFLCRFQKRTRSISFSTARFKLSQYTCSTARSAFQTSLYVSLSSVSSHDRLSICPECRSVMRHCNPPRDSAA